MDPTGVGHPLGTADRIHVLSVLLSGTQPGRKDHLMPSYETLIQAQGQTESVCHWAVVLARCYYTRIAVSLPAVKTSPVIFLVNAPDNPHSDSKLPFYEKTQNGARICPDLSDPRHYSVDLFANIQQAIQTSNPWPAVVFVLSSCFCAVDTNLHDFFSVYLRPHTMNNLTLWVPGDKEQLESSSVKIKDADIQNLISDLIHKEGNQYMFDRLTAPKWIAVISKAMRMAKALLLSADPNHLTDLGVCFHSLAKYIQVIPLALWHLPSLNEHLRSLHQDVRNLNHNPGTGYRFPLDSGICKLDKSSSETSIFLDAINAITARVSSTMHLCQQQPASIPTKCIVVDSEAMRPSNITSLDANRAIDDWLDRLVEFHQRPFRATLPVIWATTSPHIDHPETCAEASLMARLFTDAAPKPILHSTFSSNLLDINLGTDHKSCPFCVLLAESIYERYCVRFHLPDRHYQFSPWVPPKGLPDDVMDTLERKLQAYLLNRHVDTLTLYSSRRSAFIHKSLLKNPKYMIAIKNDIAGISHGEMEDVSDPEADDEFAIVYEDFRD